MTVTPSGGTFEIWPVSLAMYQRTTSTNQIALTRLSKSFFLALLSLAFGIFRFLNFNGRFSVISTTV